MWAPACLCAISDERMSRHWVFEFYEEDHPFIGFPEWVHDSNYYGKLTDGEKIERDIFQLYKEKIDLEFPDLSISETAQLADEKWLICPTCIDAWESLGDRDGMVRCPKCRQMMHNPRYRVS